MEKKHFSTIIFWGSLWGLEEITFGHLAHIIKFKPGWILWFPLAYFFTSQAYKQTKNYNSIILTSIVAAFIKLINLFMTPNFIVVISPTIAILFEGTSLFVALKLFNVNHRLLAIITASLLWRSLFQLYALTISSINTFNSVNTLLTSVILKAFINSFSIFAIITLNKKSYKLKNKLKTIENLSFRPIISFSLLVITIIIQGVL